MLLFYDLHSQGRSGKKQSVHLGQGKSGNIREIQGNLQWSEEE